MNLCCQPVGAASTTPEHMDLHQRFPHWNKIFRAVQYMATYWKGIAASLHYFTLEIISFNDYCSAQCSIRPFAMCKNECDQWFLLTAAGGFHSKTGPKTFTVDYLWNSSKVVVTPQDPLTFTAMLKSETSVIHQSFSVLFQGNAMFWLTRMWWIPN